MRLTVRLQPRAARDEIAGERNGALLVRVTAPPVDGRANDSLRRLLARELRVAPSDVRLVRGERGRDKVVEIAGADPAALDRLRGAQ